LADQITVSRSGVRNTATDGMSITPDDLGVMANSTAINTDIRIRLGVAERLLFVTPHAEHERNDIGSNGSHSDVFTNWITGMLEFTISSEVVRPLLSSGSKAGVPG